MSIPLQAARWLEQQNIETGRAPSREDADRNTAILNLLYEICRDVDSLNDRVARLENSYYKINRRETNNDVLRGLQQNRTRNKKLTYHRTELRITKGSKDHDSQVRRNVAT